MQRSGAAAIPMQTNFNDVNLLFSKDADVSRFVNLSPSVPFAEDCIDSLNALSQTLNKDLRIKKYPDVATFAFFCRRANIIQQKKKYGNEGLQRLGRGLVFHIAPSNVPVNFAYSLICGILAGNTNIVRVPSNHFEQVDIICDAILMLSKEDQYKSFASRIMLVRYERKSKATEYFSSLCDVRVIWGGDNTIDEIRKNKIPSRAYDITFADRYSLCVINADKYVNEPEPSKIASGFYNDTYLFDQNACTSPHLVVWLGKNENVGKAKKIFWDHLYEIVKSKFTVLPVIAVDKLTSFYNQSANTGKIKKIVTPDNLIWRVEMDSLPENIDEYRCTSGYFSEYHAASISELSKIINRKYQTLSYYGMDEDSIKNFIKELKPNGIDRIVPIGKTTDFSLTWDGFDLINTLSRVINISI